MDIFYLQIPINVLLITDSLNEASRFQTFFQDAKIEHHITLHQQYTLSGGIKAIELLHIDFVILDNNLSEIEDTDSLTSILSTYPELPIIYLLDKYSLHLAKEVIYKGAQTFLNKETLNSSYLVHAICWSFERKELMTKFEAVNKQIGMGYWEIDTKRNIWRNSPSLNSILETDISSMEQYLKLVHPDDQRRVALAFMQAIREAQGFQMEHRLDLGSPPKRVLLQGQPDLDHQEQVIRLRGEIKHIQTSHRPSPVSRPVVANNIPTSPKPTSHEKFTNIDYLKQVSGGDKTIMEKAISKFIETTPNMLDKMDSLLNQQDYEELAKSAHKLKSSVAMMGMEEILKTIKNIEFVSKSRERLDALPVLINRTRKMTQFAMVELQQELDSL